MLRPGTWVGEVAYLANWSAIVQAVKTEIGEAQKHSKKYDLQDGQLVTTDPAGWIYRFFFEHDISMPEGTEGVVFLGKEAEIQAECMVLSYVPPHLFLLVEEFLGEAVDNALFRPEPWKVLDSLLQVVESELIPSRAMPFFCKPSASTSHRYIDFGSLAQDYNSSQRHAGLVAASGEATAIWGPPGTGKTKTLALVLASLLQKGERALLLAPSNAAVDQAVNELTTLLERHGLDNLTGSIMRYGFPVHPKVRGHPVVSPKAWLSRLNPRLFVEWQHLEQRLVSLTNRGAAPEELKGILGKLAEIRKLAREILRGSLPQVTCLATTVAMAVSDKAVRSAGPYSLLAVDEASMVGLAFLIVLQPLAERLTLFGDFRQLPPVTASDALLVRRWLGTTGFEAWSIPRLVEQDNFPEFLQMLEVQYRMHPDLSQLVSRFAYRGRLKDNPATAEIRKKEGERGPFCGRSAVIVDLKPFGAEACRPSEGSRWNDLSATVALGLAYQALAEGLSGAAVITPYREQARLLYRMLRDLDSEDRIRVGTIHRFQGSEAPLVIVDLVEAHRRRRHWQPFFEDDAEKTASRLLTVAISRAQVRIVLLADWGLINSAAGPSRNSPLRQLVEGMPELWMETSAVGLQTGKVHNKILIVPPSMPMPKEILSSLRDAKSRVVIHWPTEQPIKRLPHELHEIVSAVHSFLGKNPAGQVLLSPANLSLGIRGAMNMSRQLDRNVEIPSSPVIVVDDHTWWHKTLSNYWLGFLKMPRTVHLLLEWTGWGLPTIRETSEDVGGGKKKRIWSDRLRCGKCNKESVTIEWGNERPLAVCCSCGQKRPATSLQVEEFLTLIGKSCKCGHAYQVKQSSTGAWGVVCSKRCQGWTNLRELLS